MYCLTQRRRGGDIAVCGGSGGSGSTGGSGALWWHRPPARPRARAPGLMPRLTPAPRSPAGAVHCGKAKRGRHATPREATLGHACGAEDCSSCECRVQHSILPCTSGSPTLKTWNKWDVCVFNFFLIMEMFQGKKTVSFWYRDIPVFLFVFIFVYFPDFYSSEERHNFKFKGKKRNNVN